ncbi:MAG: leucine-rich repeat protein [Tannerellaceae bacterium]|jgi:uncharacterized repeat protein (TIGR02543 family)|nr:leucine-rich repeat protein [Tannerellaceae bacterium]
MKTNVLNSERPFSGSVIAVCSFFLLLTGPLFFYTGCGSNDDEPEIYAVAFETGGGVPVPPNQKVEKGSPVIAPSTSPVKAGYVFVYWHVSGATAAYDFQTPVNGDLILYARWQEEATVEYLQVTWNLNGGSWPLDDNHAGQVVKGGILAEPAEPVKSGYTFDDWYKEPALSNKVAFPYDVSALTSDFTLYANWTAGGGTDDGDSHTFASLAALKSWLSGQPGNTVETAYKAGLKNVNLDSGNNWGDLGLYLETIPEKYVDLNLTNCTGENLPDGYHEWDWATNTTTFYGVFPGLKNIVAVALPSTLKTVGIYAFRKCENLHTVVLPAGITEIHQSAFEKCFNLSAVNLPDGIRQINAYAFEYCSLTAIDIPGSLAHIGDNAFYGCTFTTLTVPVTLTYWGSEAFSYNRALTSVVIEEGIESLGKNAFQECRALESVTLPQSLKTIEQSAFSDCRALKSLEIPANVTTIGPSAFYNAFASGGISVLIMRPATPPALGYEPFRYAFLEYIKVPPASVDAYKAAWRDYARKIVANTD